MSGSLSSRVMNMKFMRFSGDKDSNESNTGASAANVSSKESTVDSTTSFHDNSEWSLNDNASNNAEVKKNVKTIRLNIKRKNPIVARQVNSSTLGVTMLQRGQVSVRGKTLFGGELVVPAVEEPNPRKRTLEDGEEDGTNAKESSNDDGYDLDKIFKDTMKRKSDSNGNHNNKKSKKNKKAKKQKKN